MLRPVVLRVPWEKSVPLEARTVPSFRNPDRGSPEPSFTALLNTAKKLFSGL